MHPGLKMKIPCCVFLVCGLKHLQRNLGEVIVPVKAGAVIGRPPMIVLRPLKLSWQVLKYEKWQCIAVSKYQIKWSKDELSTDVIWPCGHLKHW